ncbi:MAG: PA2778 family cysteine peptidase, partial [Bdellovibrionales bacterium]|nr:PA2778 family cysteine peptidase [Bdellovibrionales bacterium]
MRVLTFALVMLISGCVTAPPLTSHFLNQRPVRLVNEADFISQKRNHCGPATLTMSAQRYTSDVSLSEVTSLAFTPGANGSFKGDMLSAARRIGLAAYSIPSPERMIEFVQAGHSVLLFQDLGALWIRVWHFALLLGYDTRNKTFILHSGPDAYKENSAREVLRTWERGGKWSFALVPAGVIPNGVSHEEALANAMALMAVGHQRGALELYQKLSLLWPNKYESYAGMAEVYFSQNQLTQAEVHLRKAIAISPLHPGLQFNLSQILYRSRRPSEAETA